MGYAARILLLHVIIALWINNVKTSSVDFRVERITNQPGLYYEDKNSVRIYNMQYKLVTYVPLVDIERKFTVAQLFADLTLRLCDRELKPLTNSTECEMLHLEFKQRVDEVNQAKDLISQLVVHEAYENNRNKRGILNFVGEIAKVLFGTLDNDDAKLYQSKIEEIERNEKQMLELTGEQLMIVKRTLKAVNGTLTHLQTNEFRFTEGLKDLSKKVQAFATDTNSRLHYVEIMSSLNNHLIQVYRIFSEVKSNYEMIVSAIMYAQQGILEPHILTPAKIVRSLQASQINLEAHSLPISLESPNVGSVLLSIADINIVMFQNILCYIVEIPLVEKERYQLYRLWSLPVESKNISGLYTFLETENEFILADAAKRYFARLTYRDLTSCKVLDAKTKICKQTFNIMSTHDSTDCALNLMNGVMVLPASCRQRVVSIISSIWNKLSNNVWIYVIPNKEKLTILCQSKEPTDVILTGVGKLTFYEKCKAYGDKILIQTQSMSMMNETKKDLVPPLNLEIDCCEDLSKSSKINLTSFEVKLPSLNYVNHFDDLLISGHKIDELKQHIDQQEDRINQQKIVSHYSIFTYLGVTIIFVIAFIFCCKLCKCLNLLKYLKFWKNSDGNCCAKICIKTTIVNSSEMQKSHDSDEQLGVYTRAPIRDVIEAGGRHSDSDIVSLEFLENPKDRRMTSVACNYKK